MSNFDWKHVMDSIREEESEVVQGIVMIYQAIRKDLYTMAALNGILSSPNLDAIHVRMEGTTNPDDTIGKAAAVLANSAMKMRDQLDNDPSGDTEVQQLKEEIERLKKGQLDACFDSKLQRKLMDKLNPEEET